MSEQDILDPEVLKTQTGNLSDEQEAAIKEKIEKDLYSDDEKPPKDEDEGDEEDEGAEDETEGEDEEDDEGSGKTLDDEEEDTPAEEEDSGKDDSEEKKLQAALDTEDEKRTQEQKDLVSKHEESEKKKTEAEFESNVQAYMDEEDVTEDVARKEVGHLQTLRDKYGNDTSKMSKAMLKLVRAYTVTSQELQAMKNSPKEGELVIKGKKLNKEEAREFIVEQYRKEYSGKIASLDDMSDDAVYDLGMKELKEKHRMFMEKKSREVKEGAESKRKELLQNVSENDKPFLKDVEKALKSVEDSEVISDSFNLNDYLYWARGKKYHQAVKAAEEKGYERGLQERKIVGKKGDGSSGSGGGGKGKSDTKLSSEERERALEMYDSLKIEDDKKFKMYQELKSKKLL